MRHHPNNIILCVRRRASALSPSDYGRWPIRTPDSRRARCRVEQTNESEAARIKLERRITLDIEVADSTGKAVRGLSQNDFVVTDNGEPKSLTSFQEIDGRTVQPPVEAILLIDAMNATFEDVGIIGRESTRFFARMAARALRLPMFTKV